MDLYFSEYFKVKEAILDEYGALDISVVSDLPLFIDPFLLFNSPKPEYQKLHDGILTYLYFLRDKASANLSPGLLKNWYQFPEVRQNWLGFTFLGNGGSALGRDFAESLNSALGQILSNFGSEDVTESSHLEKLCLIKPGVGRDNISDFTTNLIKQFLLEYTQSFAQKHIDAKLCETFAVRRVTFDYATESWTTGSYYLPKLNDDFVLLTPRDMLTRDETWINYSDMLRNFEQLAPALPDDQLRAQLDNYFRGQLSVKPTQKEKKAAAHNAIMRYPAFIDYYIKAKEDDGQSAVSTSANKVGQLDQALIEQVKTAVSELVNKSSFYHKPWTSYDEALARVKDFKDYVENQDGYRVINKAGKLFSQEMEVQLFFGLIWCNNDFDINREPNNGRGPVDFKVSYGSRDKSLIEFKLASNRSLKRNLQKQIEIYEKANKTHTSVKVIISYTTEDQVRVDKILKDLNLTGSESIILIDARADNKPSASKAS